MPSVNSVVTMGALLIVNMSVLPERCLGLSYTGDHRRDGSPLPSRCRVYMPNDAATYDYANSANRMLREVTAPCNDRIGSSAERFAASKSRPQFIRLLS